MPEPYASLVSGLADLLQIGKFSDLKIVCGEREFAVHKNIICCQSQPLMAMCTNGMKESQESVIDLTIDTEPCVSRLVDFLYRCNYDALEDDSEDARTDNRGAKKVTVTSWGDDVDNDEPPSHGSNASPAGLAPAILRQLSLHVDMYVLAAKYDIGTLGELAKEKFQEVAEQRGRAPERLPVLETIPKIYATTGDHNRGLRDVVVEYVRLQRPETYHRDRSPPPPENQGSFRDRVARLFDAVPGFALDVSRSWLETPYLGYCNNASCRQIVHVPVLECGWCRGDGNKPSGGDPGSPPLWSLDAERQWNAGSWD